MFAQLCDAPLQGHLGHLTLNIPWANLTSKPAEIVIEDLYVLAVPAAESKVDLEEDETRAQASKQERLKNAEVFQKSGKDLNADDDKRTQGVFESLVAKIVNNVQVTVKNVHVRYEDKLSVPGVCRIFTSCRYLLSLTATMKSAPICCWRDARRVHCGINRRHVGTSVYPEHDGCSSQTSHSRFSRRLLQY